jgi:hypothetical protein
MRRVNDLKILGRILSGVAVVGLLVSTALLVWFWLSVRRPPRAVGAELTPSRIAYEHHYIALSQTVHLAVVSILAVAGTAIIIRRVIKHGWSLGYVVLPFFLATAFAGNLVLIHNYVWHWQQALGWATVYFVVLPLQTAALLAALVAELPWGVPEQLTDNIAGLRIASTAVALAWTVPASFAFSIYQAGGWRSTI